MWLSVLGTCIQFEYMIDIYQLYFSGMQRAFNEKQIKKCDKAKDSKGQEDLEKQEQARQKTDKVLVRKCKVSDKFLNALERRNTGDGSNQQIQGCYSQV